MHLCVRLLQWVNLATVVLLLFAPANRQLEAAVYALADGPLAAALIVWQNAWVFGSPTHVVRWVPGRVRCRAACYAESSRGFVIIEASSA